MSVATWKGKPVALPGSKRYKILPDWVLQELDKPRGKSVRRIRHPSRGQGLTVPEAQEEGFCKSHLYAWAKEGGDGIPDLGGEILKSWFDYKIAPDGKVYRILVFSEKQLNRILDVRARKADAFRTKKGFTDSEAVQRHSDVLKARNTFTGWRNDHCIYLGRRLVHWKENGYIVNDPDDVDTIAKKLREAEKSEWTDPATGELYLSTEVVMRDYAIPPYTLEFYKTNDANYLNGGRFHPEIPFKRGAQRGHRRFWLKSEVELFHQSREAALKVAQAKRSSIIAFLKEAVANGPMRAEDGTRLAQRAGFSRYLLYQCKHLAGVLTHRQGPNGPYVWYLGGTDPRSVQAIQDDDEWLKAHWPAALKNESPTPVEAELPAEHPGITKKKAGRPKGRIDPEVWERNEAMVKEWRENRAAYSSIADLADHFEVGHALARKVISEASKV